MPTMTEDEFWEHYARGSGLSIEELRGLGLQALACDCGEPACRGWRMDMSEAINEEILRRIQKATASWPSTRSN